MINPDRNYGCRISDEWELKGLKTIVMENEFLRITILADKGSDIYEFLYKPLDIDFMWRTPMGLRNPYRERATRETASGSFVDYYEGGWQEILPSGGAPCNYGGIEYGQHGEISNVPWKSIIIIDVPDEVSCLLKVRALRTPLSLEKTLTLKSGKPMLYIHEKLTNESPERIDLMWGHHLAFGEPFLDENCRIDSPAQKIYIHPESYSKNHRFKANASFNWPFAETIDGRKVDFHEIPPRTQKSEDMTYLLDLKEPWFALTHMQKRVGFALRWDKSLFKYLWYWQVFGGGEGYPWYSRTYNIGLEPWTSYTTSGLAEAVKKGTHLTLNPQEEIETDIMAIIYAGLKKVKSISRSGNVK